MSSKKGLLSKSPYYIWAGIVKGLRWEARALCRSCALALIGLVPEEPEVPPVDLPWWAELQLEDRGFIEDADKASTLKLLDVVTNVPTAEKPEVELYLVDSVGCPMPGHTEITIVWRKV